MKFDFKIKKKNPFSSLKNIFWKSIFKLEIQLLWLDLLNFTIHSFALGKWKQAGDFCQFLWKTLLDFLQVDDLQLFVYGKYLNRTWIRHSKLKKNFPPSGGYLVTMVTYWLFGFLYLLVDIYQWPRWLYACKIQPEANNSIQFSKLLPVRNKCFNQSIITSFLIIY